jgi:hypothetical protein
MYSYSLILLWEEAALAIARETARIAFAPSLDFDHPNWFFVPSNYYTMNLSIYFCYVTYFPINAGPII